MNNMTSRHHRARPGIALVMVLSAIAIASVLGFALLSGGMLQTRTSNNSAKMVQADYLAESGLNLAMYYLENPEKAPTRNAQGYWPGGDLTLSTNPPMSMTVTVARDATHTTEFEVSCVGKVGNSGESQLQRTAKARVNQQMGFKMKYAFGATGNLNVNNLTQIDGDIISLGTVALKAGSSVTGKVYAPSMSMPVGYSNPPSNPAVPDGAIAAPDNNQVNRYATYTYNGQSGTAETFPGIITSLPVALAPMNASASNPAKVWIAESNLILNDNFILDGTLVVKGSLTINGQNISITPKSGMPGLIVIGSLIVNHSRKSATINGLTYVGNQLKHGGVLIIPADASTLTINGGLLLGASSTPIASTYNVITKVKLDSALTKVPDLTSTGTSPLSVSISRWGNEVTAPY